MSSTFDTIVIGSGPGGYVAAVRSAQLGLSTAVIERDDVVGGRCLNYACIPAKAVLRSAEILSEVREAGEFGILLNGTEPTVDFDAISERRTKVIGTLTGGVSGLFKKNGVEVISGEDADRRGRRQGRRHGVHGQPGRDPGDRQRQEAAARAGLRRQRDRDRGGVGVARMIHGHPTLSEGVMEAARAADGWLIHG